MSKYHLAQLNVAKMQAPLDSPLMEEFVNNLDRINTLAEESPGFVWRLQTDEGDATALRPFGDDVLVNMSVWEDIQSLRAFVFSSDHVEIMRKRRNWFERMSEAYVVLWWIKHGGFPTIEDAAPRLENLRQLGPTEYAFTLRSAYPAPDDPQASGLRVFEDECPAT